MKGTARRTYIEGRARIFPKSLTLYREESSEFILEQRKCWSSSGPLRDGFREVARYGYRGEGKVADFQFTQGKNLGKGLLKDMKHAKKKGENSIFFKKLIFLTFFGLYILPGVLSNWMSQRNSYCFSLSSIFFITRGFRYKKDSCVNGKTIFRTFFEKTETMGQIQFLWEKKRSELNTRSQKFISTRRISEQKLNDE